jgi:uncharacterized protein
MENEGFSRKWGEIALVFVTFFLPGFLAQSTAPEAGNFNDPWFHVRYAVSAVPQILLILYLIDVQPDDSLSEFGIRPPRLADLTRALPVYLGIFAVLLPVAMLAGIVDGRDVGSFSDSFRWQFSRPVLIPLVAVTTLLTGYREELFFRAHMLTRLEQLGVPPAMGVAASALLFSIGHVYQGIAGFAVALAIGIYLSAVFLRFRSLHLIAIAHGAYNFTSLMLNLALA